MSITQSLCISLPERNELETNKYGFVHLYANEIKLQFKQFAVDETSANMLVVKN